MSSVCNRRLPRGEHRPEADVFPQITVWTSSRRSQRDSSRTPAGVGARLLVLVRNMLRFASAPAVDFLPPEDARAWLADGLARHVMNLGEPARAARILEPTTTAPRDLDDLFELMCGVQAQIGQRDVEFSLVELTPGERPPVDFERLGDGQGQLACTLHRGGQYVVLAVPALFRVPQLVYATVARELGRIAIHRSGHAPRQADEGDPEADAELAAVALGMGVWVANGAYVFENACCGGGCGLDLKSLRAGLSLPEACFALALDGRRRDLSRRSIARHLEPTQRAAFKASWSSARDRPALVAAASVGALEG
jgi:hypothetical protein